MPARLRSVVGWTEDAAISSILQDADVDREVDAVARERAHGQSLVNYLRDQDAPHDAAATEKAAREGVLAELTNQAAKSDEGVDFTGAQRDGVNGDTRRLARLVASLSLPLTRPFAFLASRHARMTSARERHAYAPLPC